ncbi:unnamed protein product [Paramecium octaurelia]|uniref:Uncharacterized protein n=1 Tax=Paramecium octaurelia TaxID=43137 RepID=A0A8S1WRZ7_PAROT|nr:unnamed protein product [Paramecium octaurelia]
METQIAFKKVKCFSQTYSKINSKYQSQIHQLNQNSLQFLKQSMWKIMLLSCLIIIGQSALQPSVLNFMQGYAFGVGMGDEVPEIMDCVLDVILVKPQWDIILKQFNQGGAINIWNGLSDILFSFDQFAQQCGNTTIGLNKIQKHIRKIFTTPKLFKQMIENMSRESDKVSELTCQFVELMKEQDTYQSGYVIGQLISIVFEI